MSILTVIVTQILINHIPFFDITPFVSIILKYLGVPLTNSSIHDAVELWFTNRQECISRYGDIRYCDVSQVTEMDKLFYDRRDVTELDLNEWDVSNVTSMEGMLYDRVNLQQLSVDKWNVNVTNMTNMFHYCYNIQMDISN